MNLYWIFFIIIAVINITVIIPLRFQIINKIFDTDYNSINDLCFDEKEFYYLGTIFIPMILSFLSYYLFILLPIVLLIWFITKPIRKFIKHKLEKK